MSLEEPTFDLDILLEPDYKEIIEDNRVLFNKEYDELRKNYEKYKTLDVKSISPEDMVKITLNYIYYKSYKIIDHYSHKMENLDHYYRFEDDFKFRTDLYEPKYAEAHRLFILYLDSVELLYQLILAHTVVNNIYTLEKSIVKNQKTDYDPKNMFDSLNVGLKYKDLIRDWCNRDKYKLLNVCVKSFYPSKIRQLKLFYKNKVKKIERINNSYYRLFNMLYLHNKYKDILCNIYNVLIEVPKNIPKNRIIQYLGNYVNISFQKINECNGIDKDFSFVKLNDYCIIYPKILKNYVESCIKQKKFIILYILLIYKEVGHGNMLIYNPNFNEVEIFEPHGVNDNDNIFKKFVKEIFPNDVKYISQDNFKHKFQRENFELLSKETGHCVTWSIWYADKRLEYPNLNAITAYEKIYNNLFQEDKYNFQKIMRDYIDFIKLQREYVLNNVKIDPIIKELLENHWKISDPIQPTPEVFKSRISLGSSRLRAKENLLKTKKEISELEKKILELQRTRELNRKQKVKKMIEQRRVEKRRKSAEKANPFKPPRTQPPPVGKPPKGLPPPPLVKR